MKTTTISIKCDSCKEELVEESKYPASFALKLETIDVGTNSSGVVFAITVIPPLEREHHFCGLGCLKKWVSNKT